MCSFVCWNFLLSSFQVYRLTKFLRFMAGWNSFKHNYLISMQEIIPNIERAITLSVVTANIVYLCRHIVGGLYVLHSTCAYILKQPSMLTSLTCLLHQKTWLCHKIQQKRVSYWSTITWFTYRLIIYNFN